MNENNMPDIADTVEPDCETGSLIEREWDDDPAPGEEADQPPFKALDIKEDGWDALEREGLTADQSFVIRYLGEDQRVSKEEMVTLAQKGKDYDRIRSRADALTAAVSSLASRLGTTAEELLRRGAGNEEAAAHERRNREAAEFLREYEGIDPLSIPGEVWDDVSRGTPLTEAYRRHENLTLRSIIQSGEREAENRRRSTGPRDSSGMRTRRDAIEMDWYGNDY